jgi:hypothetical protein
LNRSVAEIKTTRQTCASAAPMGPANTSQE